MKTICLNFQIHQPYRLKRYRFFDMGKDHDYLDDIEVQNSIEQLSKHCYVPANELLLRLIDEHKDKFKINFMVSGVAFEQLKKYAPEVVSGLKKLAKSGCVEFLASTYAGDLSSLMSKTGFREQIKEHHQMIVKEFEQEPTSFVNSNLIYSDQIGDTVAKMGYNTIISEGAKHVLGWKSANFLYANPINDQIKVSLRNYKLSEDISFRFSDRSWGDWPLTADKFVSWFRGEGVPGEMINLYMDYESIGVYNHDTSGIFQFLEHFVRIAIDSGELKFGTISETSERLKCIGTVSVPHPISWSDEERDVSLWMGNELQNEALSKLYALRGAVKTANTSRHNQTWNHLQSAEHFFYMATKWFSSKPRHTDINPYDSSYDAFINYMNILSDFEIEVRKAAERAEAKTKK